MTDDLRTRLAAVLADAIVGNDNLLALRYGNTGTVQVTIDPHWLADAVIRELELREETGWFGPTNIYKHRYVTEWTADE